MVNEISLLELIKLVNNKEISEKYVNYLCGFDSAHKYRHDEIELVAKLVSFLTLTKKESDGFLYGYSINQLNKEFDLLKICADSCINIELKTMSPGIKKIKKQLVSNRHYLRLLNVNVDLYTYIGFDNTLYKLNDNDELDIITDHSELHNLLNQESVSIDLDEVFSPKNVLVSPLNSPEKFINNNYILTENQETIKQSIISNIEIGIDSFSCLTGSPGTGKTLLLYDIAFELAKKYKILIFHCGIMCDGHHYLNRHSSDNITISEAKVLRLRDIKGYDLVFVDEAHRMYPTHLDKIIKYVPKANAKCVFSFDESQRLSNFENRITTVETIKGYCGDSVYKLTTKIRTNKEIAGFITCLRDLSKYNDTMRFGNIKVVYEEDNQEAVRIAINSEKEGYKYISYTPSTYNTKLNYQESRLNTHKVIGQEYDGVTMIINHDFFYHGNALSAYNHPNPDYIYTQLLYQGLTRARTKILLIIQEKEVLSKVLDLLSKSKH